MGQDDTSDDHVREDDTRDDALDAAVLRADGATGADAASARRVILVVEDDPLAARLIVRALRDEPTQVEVAGDAREAIAILGRAQARVILMDVKLPGTDGVALTTMLKANPTLRDIPIVMITGDATRETLTRSMSAGAAGFIVKPFDRAGLLAKLLPFLG